MTTRRGWIALAALLAGVAAVNFLCMPGEFLAGDPHAWREEARSIVLSGELNVPRAGLLGQRGAYFAQNERNGLHYSKFGIANSLLAVPPILLEKALGGDITRHGTRPACCSPTSGTWCSAWPSPPCSTRCRRPTRRTSACACCGSSERCTAPRSGSTSGRKTRRST
jgi:hypothetical protein